MRVILQKDKFFLQKNSSALVEFCYPSKLYSQRHLDYSFYCPVIPALWSQLHSQYSNLTTAISKHEWPSGLSFIVKTQRGPNYYCSELFLSGPQQTRGLRNKRVNLYPKTYSNFRRSCSTWTTHLSPIFISGQYDVTPSPPRTEKAPCHMCIQTLHIWPTFTLC